MSEEPTYKKKLIEVALPLDAINAESAREKSIRHGHPSTLHLWWARRPLAACRAVLFSQLVDDPSAHPDKFPTEEEQDTERQRLFAIIAALVKWENSTNEDVLDAARAEIRRSCDGDPPPILDPFAGGGSIPLEAQRLGLEAHASDLNPVAVLINKALIEIPPRWADHAPVHPDAENRTRWKGSEGLAEDVRRYGQWMRDEAEKRIGHLYPKATLPDGSAADVVAWVWARDAKCPNPGCSASMPLVRSLWLSKKKGNEAWLKPTIAAGRVRFDIGRGPAGPDRDGTVGRSGALCLVCGEPAKLEYVRSEARAGRMGTQLVAIVAAGKPRVYLPAEPGHVAAAKVSKPKDYPGGELFDWPGRINVVRYGLTEFHMLFSDRQLVALTTYSGLVAEARTEIATRSAVVGLAEQDAHAYADAVSTYLSLGVSRLADIQNSLCRWESSRGQVRNLFARQAIPMVWDFGEAGLFSNAAGDFEVSLGSLIASIAKLPGSGPAVVDQGDARTMSGSAVVATDPPYYDNIGYADLSDFFYVWLRQSLRHIYPNLFGTMVTPKTSELIATQFRHDGSKSAAEEYFEEGFVDVFSAALGTATPGYPMTLFYAFKQSESDEEGSGEASTGWSTMLEGLAAAGWMVTATWPMRTELANKIGMKANMLASSVVLACRPRPAAAGMTDRQGLIRALQQELPGPLADLQKAHIAPVDLRQAAIGPGMAVFSRFSKVIEPDSSSMSVRTALVLINQVLDELLDEQTNEFDAETRWAVSWFSQFFLEKGAYGTAEQLAVAMNIAVESLVDAGILESGQGKARLLGWEDLPDGWDPRDDDHVPVWEATLHLVKRLAAEGEASAARLLGWMPPGMGDASNQLAYRLYTLCERSRPALAGPFNALVASWPEILRQSRDWRDDVGTGEQQGLGI